MTGHGDLNAYLKQYRHRGSKACDCGKGIEDVVHIILTCESQTDLRDVLGQAIGRVVEKGFPLKAMLSSRENLGHCSRGTKQFIFTRLGMWLA